MPENIFPGRSESHGVALRLWGNAHPTVEALHAMLPAYPADRATPSVPGLYVDGHRAPWVTVRGEVRVSLARLIVVLTDGRHQLVGQVQATASESSFENSMTLRFYLHQPAGIIAREVPDVDRWWVDVLDSHYRSGGELLSAPASGVAA